MSSATTRAGRVITSPAAIWATVASSSRWIVGPDIGCKKRVDGFSVFDQRFGTLVVAGY